FSLFILIAQKKWKWIALVFLLSISGAVLYLRYAQRQFQESSTLQISSQNNASKVLGQQQQPAAAIYETPDEELAQAIELIHSSLFLERVFRTMNLSVSYY